MNWLKSSLDKKSYIRKKDGEYCVYSEKGRSFGCYPSRKKAEERLRQIEMFKHMKSALKGWVGIKEFDYEDPKTGKIYKIVAKGSGYDIPASWVDPAEFSVEDVEVLEYYIDDEIVDEKDFPKNILDKLIKEAYEEVDWEEI